METNIRITLEKRVLRFTAKSLIAKGWKLVSVDNGEERVKVSTIKEMIEQVFSVDDSYIFFTKDNEPGSMYLFVVLGNSPWEVISDFGGNAKMFDQFSKDMEEAGKYSDKMESQLCR
jgi:hypothetical protein